MTKIVKTAEELLHCFAPSHPPIVDIILNKYGRAKDWNECLLFYSNHAYTRRGYTQSLRPSDFMDPENIHFLREECISWVKYPTYEKDNIRLCYLMQYLIVWLIYFYGKLMRA